MINRRTLLRTSLAASAAVLARARLAAAQAPAGGHGAGPFGLIDMGGMFTILKVRKQLTGDADPGWYDHPEGSVATTASADELARDGIKVP